MFMLQCYNTIVLSILYIGTKGVARDMKKICAGTHRDEGIKCFSELSDKGKSNEHKTTPLAAIKKPTDSNQNAHHHT